MLNIAEEALPSPTHTGSMLAGISGRNRQVLTALSRAFPGPFDAAQAASVLEIDTARARRLLAGLADGGWLARVRRGWYILVPLEASEPMEWREDPWILAATLFAPGYLGGWSAAEHWGLTDQIFRSIYVIVGRTIRPRHQNVQGTDFIIRTVPEGSLFGTRRVWRRQVPVNVSDPHRTVIDVLDIPASGGGALHVSEVLETYFESEYVDLARLLEYGDRLGRGTVFKRLGYLVERGGMADADFVEVCRSRITAGISRIEPDRPSTGPIVSRWNLRVNVAQLAPEKLVAQ